MEPVKAALPRAEPVIVEGPKNRTVVQGARVAFPCLLESSSSSSASNGSAGGTSILWQLNGGSLSSQGSSPWRQLDSGTLVLDRVDVADSGPYRCIVRNAHGVARSEPAHLVVHELSARCPKTIVLIYAPRCEAATVHYALLFVFVFVFFAISLSGAMV
ncbi:hypothetical protein HPB48_020996 [Haemaphysalis longicornis]|uniref:Ig-like domain-containing protein n=1 Tax=Haemaphysalis longicornis TaxID=44386 RepID=A0A9J6FW49_HAELO|nr:hypothetical protein HPB48_020996 [Haemaphysalis longicornis]